MMIEAGDMRGDPSFMMSLARGLAVIKAFEGSRQPLRVGDVAKRSGLSRAVAGRCVYTLHRLGYVIEVESGRYALSPNILTLGFAYLSSSPLADSLQSVVADVTQITNESCSAFVLEGFEVIAIARSRADRALAIERPIGSRLPAAYASAGRVILSDMARDELARWLEAAPLEPMTSRATTTREEVMARIVDAGERGYSINQSEIDESACGISVPVRDRSGRVVAALNVGGPTNRLNTENMIGEILPTLRKAAAHATNAISLPG